MNGISHLIALADGRAPLISPGSVTSNPSDTEVAEAGLVLAKRKAFLAAMAPPVEIRLIYEPRGWQVILLVQGATRSHYNNYPLPQALFNVVEAALESSSVVLRVADGAVMDDFIKLDVYRPSIAVLDCMKREQAAFERQRSARGVVGQPGAEIAHGEPSGSGTELLGSGVGAVIHGSVPGSAGVDQVPSGGETPEGATSSTAKQGGVKP